MKRCVDPVVRSYWKGRYSTYDTRFRNEIISPIENKVGVLLANPYLRTILCQTSRSLDLAKLMNEEKIVIVNLAKGGLGAEPSHLLGALLIAGFAQAAESRRSIPEEARKDFTLVADEFQNFATDSFGTILSESRKWRLNLVAVNQQLAQLPENLKHAVFGNAGTLVAFRVGAQDADQIGAELGMNNPAALRETSNYKAWIRLMYRGVPNEPKFFESPAPLQMASRFHRVVALNNERRQTRREDAERIIASFLDRDFRRGKQQHNSKRRSPDR